MSKRTVKEVRMEKPKKKVPGRQGAQTVSEGAGKPVPGPRIKLSPNASGVSWYVGDSETPVNSSNQLSGYMNKVATGVISEFTGRVTIGGSDVTTDVSEVQVTFAGGVTLKILRESSDAVSYFQNGQLLPAKAVDSDYKWTPALCGSVGVGGLKVRLRGSPPEDPLVSSKYVRIKTNH